MRENQAHSAQGQATAEIGSPPCDSVWESAFVSTTKLLGRSRCRRCTCNSLLDPWVQVLDPLGKIRRLLRCFDSYSCTELATQSVPLLQEFLELRHGEACQTIVGPRERAP